MWWNKYIGRQFQEKGRGPDVFDCWGLCQYVYRHDHPSKILLPGYDECYESTQDRDKLAALIFEESNQKWLAVDKPQEFDVVVINMRGVPMHVGIVTHKGHMIHCAHGIGTVHDRYDSIRWANKVIGFFRHE